MSSTVAPNEKHLEDWIVNNFEMFGTDSWGDGHYTFFDRLIARQYPLPNGRPDLITMFEGTITIVELKKGELTYGVLGQCLRYIHDMKFIYGLVREDLYSQGMDTFSQYQYSTSNIFLEVTEFPTSEFTGMIVGHSVADRDLPLVAATCGVQTVTYELINGEYIFTHHFIETDARVDDYKRHLNEAAGTAIRSMMRFRNRRDSLTWRENE